MSLRLKILSLTGPIMVIIVLLDAFVINPVRHLVKAAQHLAQGNFDIDLPHTQNDEVAGNTWHGEIKNTKKMVRIFGFKPLSCRRWSQSGQTIGGTPRRSY